MRLTPLTANTFLSDGGAMFGLVPKPIWEKHCPADEFNAIPQHANVFFVETNDGRRGLLDTGCGDPAGFTERERHLSGLESHWRLPQSLHEHNLEFNDIDWVALTHAHWDHAGGLLHPDGAPTFPRAQIFLRRTELDSALSGDPLLHKSYPPSVTRSLEILANRINPLDDHDTEIAPGVHLLAAPGHTEGQAAFLLSNPEPAGTEHPLPAALFPGDNCPTQHHLHTVYQTSYDTLPLQTRAWKHTWLPRCVDEDILLLFSHDPLAFGAWIQPHPKHEFTVKRLYDGVTP